MSKMYKMKIGNGFYYGKKKHIMERVIANNDIRNLHGKPLNYENLRKKLAPYSKTRIVLNGETVTIEEVAKYEF